MSITTLHRIAARWRFCLEPKPTVGRLAVSWRVRPNNKQVHLVHLERLVHRHGYANTCIVRQVLV